MHRSPAGAANADGPSTRLIPLDAAVAPFTWRRMARAADQLGFVAPGSTVARGPSSRWRRRCGDAVVAALEDHRARLGAPGGAAGLWRPAFGGYHLGRVLLGTEDDTPVGSDSKAVIRALRRGASRLDAAGSLDALCVGIGGLVESLAVEWAGEAAHPAWGDGAAMHVEMFEHALGVAALEADLVART